MQRRLAVILATLVASTELAAAGPVTVGETRVDLPDGFVSSPEATEKAKQAFTGVANVEVVAYVDQEHQTAAFVLSSHEASEGRVRGFIADYLKGLRMARAAGKELWFHQTATKDRVTADQTVDLGGSVQRTRHILLVDRGGQLHVTSATCVHPSGDDALCEQIVTSVATSIAATEVKPLDSGDDGGGGDLSPYRMGQIGGGVIGALLAIAIVGKLLKRRRG